MKLIFVLLVGLFISGCEIKIKTAEIRCINGRLYQRDSGQIWVKSYKNFDNACLELLDAQ